MFSLLTIVATVAASLSSMPGGPSRTPPLYDWEAKTLIFLVPTVQRSVEAGFTISFAPQSGPKLNADSFLVYRAEVDSGSPSDLIGTFAVNRYTADVIDVDLDAVVNGPDLAAVQAVIRHVHGIGERTLNEHRDDKVFRQH